MIKTPVRVVETRTSDYSPHKYCIEDDGGNLIISDFNKSIIHEIAAALNGPAVGSFEWAWKWMMENKGEWLEYGKQGFVVKFSGVRFWTKHKKEKDHYPFELDTEHTTALDWRPAEV